MRCLLAKLLPVDGLLFEKDRNAFADGIHQAPVPGDQGFGQGFGERLGGAIAELAGADRRIEASRGARCPAAAAAAW